MVSAPSVHKLHMGETREEACPQACAVRRAQPLHSGSLGEVIALKRTWPGSAEQRDLAFLREGGARSLEEVDLGCAMSDGWHLTKGNKEEEPSRRRAEPEQRPDADRRRPGLNHNTLGWLQHKACDRESRQDSLQLWGFKNHVGMTVVVPYIQMAFCSFQSLCAHMSFNFHNKPVSRQWQRLFVTQMRKLRLANLSQSALGDKEKEWKNQDESPGLPKPWPGPFPKLRW